MSELSPSATRRRVVSAIGAGLAAGAFGSTGAASEQADQAYVIAQGDACTPIVPFRGEQPVESFYDYRLPERYVSDENGATAGSPAYASSGTVAIQRPATSIAFLYRGPGGVSLVLVHGSLDAADAGSVSFDITGLPESGAWLVKDDLYRDPDTGELATANYDRWQVDGTDHVIDWTWGSSGTDGGAFGYLGGDFDVVVDPSFNEASTLYDRYYTGTVAAWNFVSNETDGLAYVSLDMTRALRIRTGSCADVPVPDPKRREREKRDRKREERDKEREKRDRKRKEREKEREDRKREERDKERGKRDRGREERDKEREKRDREREEREKEPEDRRRKERGEEREDQDDGREEKDQGRGQQDGGPEEQDREREERDEEREERDEGRKERDREREDGDEEDGDEEHEERDGGRTEDDDDSSDG